MVAFWDEFAGGEAAGATRASPRAAAGRSPIQLYLEDRSRPRIDWPEIFPRCT